MPAKPTTPARQQIGARVDSALLIETRVLAVRQKRRVNELIEEALQDLLKKYQGKRKESK